MDINTMIEEIKTSPDYHKAGMILCHNGVVRENSRDGKKVSGLEIFVDHYKLEKLIRKYKSKPGIIDIKIYINEGQFLCIGEDVMYLAVAGDVRENVLSVMNDMLNSIKKDITYKKEVYVQEANHG